MVVSGSQVLFGLRGAPEGWPAFAPVPYSDEIVAGVGRLLRSTPWLPTPDVGRHRP